ncbi:MAG: gliding motility-associated C-terminal domain-containing protein [Hymenobacteraceae bacterium]|nr:gliding motility-associated C-terminal domain-containing protein [Hymenobacteraceae bacterium]
MMKNFTLLLFLLCMAFAFNANASHEYGAAITYQNISPNVYKVDYHYIRFCNTINIQSVILSYRAPGCTSAGGNVTLQQVSSTPSGLYAPGAPTTCASASNTLVDYETLTFSGIVTLPDTCSNWILSVRETTRGGSVNLGNVSGAAPVYVEAMINNLNGIANSSPQFFQSPVAVLPQHQLSILNYGVFDAEGDSLVYSLQSTESDYQVPHAYSTGFSAQQPFGPNANPGFSISPYDGTIKVQPTVFNTGSGGNQFYNNLYYVGIRVDEYRKINGNYVKIGHSRSDIPYWVVSGVNNQPPTLMPIVNNNTNYTSGDVIDIAAGAPVTLQLRATDPDVANQLSFISNYDRVLNGATSSVSGSSANPTLTINWTPSVADIREQPYFISIDVKDNAQLNGRTNHTIGLRVRQVTGVADKIEVNSPLVPGLLVRGQQFILDRQLEGAQVQILSAQGQVVKQYNQYQNQWTGEGLASGIYFYKITKPENGKSYAGKLLLTQ